MSEQKEWLTRVHENIKWRFDGPNIKNPFDSEASETALESYVSDRNALMAVTVVKAVMDETEIIRITDLTSLEFETEHPNLINLERADLQKYLEEHGVWDQIGEEIIRFQENCKEELVTRGG